MDNEMAFLANMQDYIDERYPELNLSADAYLEYLAEQEFEAISRPYGFIVYKLQGDACIINDLYTTPEYRKKKEAWTLFNELRDMLKTNTQCKVLIGFSEHLGKGHEHGQGAMKAAGFTPAHKNDIAQVYMRGNY